MDQNEFSYYSRFGVDTNGHGYVLNEIEMSLKSLRRQASAK